MSKNGEERVKLKGKIKERRRRKRKIFCRGKRNRKSN